MQKRVQLPFRCTLALCEEIQHVYVHIKFLYVYRTRFVSTRPQFNGMVLSERLFQLSLSFRCTLFQLDIFYHYSLQLASFLLIKFSINTITMYKINDIPFSHARLVVRQHSYEVPLTASCQNKLSLQQKTTCTEIPAESFI